MLYTLKKTLDLILSLNTHFLAQVKRNCRKLWESIALYTALCEPISSCEYYQKEHGREVFRRVELYNNKAILPQGWNGIETLIKVRRWGKRNDIPFDEVSFFISSKSMHSALLAAKAIQGHWSIENGLHWVKDVLIKEDKMSIKDMNAVAIIVYMNNAAFNTLRMAGYKPIKDTFAKFANKVKELYNLFDKNYKT